MSSDGRLQHETLDWITASIGSGARVLQIMSMPEASHTNHRVRVVTPSGAEGDLVLRRYTDLDRLRTDAWYVPEHEVDALTALEGAALPAPRLVAADVDAASCDAPTLLLTFVPGNPPPDDPAELSARVRALAEPLAAIHSIAPGPVRRPYATYFVSDGKAATDLHPPPWSADPSMWERAFAALQTAPPDTPSAFIHRDYHHGNTLWQDEQLTGVIDWTTGCLGPPGIDLARERLNLVWDVGLEVADAFLLEAEAIGVGGHHPYWDLLDAADWPSDDPPKDEDEAVRYRRYEDYVARALAEIGA